jgi:hypothetical protein
MPYAFLYGVTLGRNTNELMASVPRTKHTIRRAEIYARSEVEAILSAPRRRATGRSKADGVW